MKPSGPRRADADASPAYRDIVGRVASNVRRLRAARRWTQVQAAVRCELEISVFQSVERATGNFTAWTLARLVEGFSVEPGEFMVPALPPAKRRPGRPRRATTSKT